MIAILMAVRDGAKFLPEQLKSIKEQTYGDWRLIARDDGSADGSLDKLRAFAGEAEGKVDVYVNDPPTGSAKKNFAKLLKDAAGQDYTMFCDQDDVWQSDKLAVCMDAMRKLESSYGKDVPLLVHSDARVTDEKMNIVAKSLFEYSKIRRRPSLAQLIVQNNATGCTMLMNNCLVEGIADIAGRDEIIMHDCAAALYAKVFGHTVLIERPLVSYRQHGFNSVGAKDADSGAYLLKRLSDGKAKYRRQMGESCAQAGFFSKQYGERMLEMGLADEYRLMDEYGRLFEKSHAARVRFYFANGAWKRGFARKIMQLIWG